MLGDSFGHAAILRIEPSPAEFANAIVCRPLPLLKTNIHLVQKVFGAMMLFGEVWISTLLDWLQKQG
jgi:hypothetical protein